MKQIIQNYDGLYGEPQPVGLPDFVQIERLETRSQRHKWEIKPHIHQQLFQLFCLETGRGTIWSESGGEPFESPCLWLIPENTLHGFLYEQTGTGTVLTISAAFIDGLAAQLPFLHGQSGQIQSIDMSRELPWFAYLQTLLGRLAAEAADALPGRAYVLQSLLSALLTDVFRHAHQQQQQAVQPKNRSLTLFRAFQRSIRQSRNPQKSIRHYAEEQHITAVHLNRVCRDLTQKPAMQIVYDYFMTEARTYLTHTDWPISEVAYQLHFEDAAYFSRLFRKQTGLTPRDFRRSQTA